MARSLVPVVVFLVCLLWRSPVLFLHPRFWAEEGSVYYARLHDVGRLGGLVQVFNGNYQLLTNLLVEVALRVPVPWAPAVTTYLSLAVAMACAWLIGQFLLARDCSLSVAGAACALFALQPAGYEVFMSATNVQWVTSVIGLMLLVSDDAPALGASAVPRYVALLACGLTGTTTCILFPLFVLGALWRRSGFGWVMVVLLGAATATQAGVIVEHRGDIHRAFELSRWTPVALSLHVFFAEFLPAQMVDAMGATTAPATLDGGMSAFQVVAVGAAGMTLIVLTGWRKIGRFSGALIALAMVMVSLIDEVGALAKANDMLSGWAGGRYFFFGTSALIVLLAAGLDGWSRVTSGVLVALALSNGATTVISAPWATQNLTGPSFSEQLQACRGRTSCQVQVWPLPYQGFVTVTPPR